MLFVRKFNAFFDTRPRLPPLVGRHIWKPSKAGKRSFVCGQFWSEEEVGLREVGKDNKKAAAAVVVVLLIACRPQNSRKFHKPRGRKF